MDDIDTLWDFSNPAVSEARFREHIPRVKSASEKIVLLTQIARAQGLQDRFADAHVTLSEAEALLKSEQSIARVRYLLERGRVFNSAKETGKAAISFQKAMALANGLGEDFYAIDAAHMLGVCLPQPESTQWNERALEMAEQTEDPRARGWQGPILNNMGWTSFDAGDYPKALDYLQRALNVREERKEKPQILVAKWAVARTLRALGRVREALVIQEALLLEHEKAGTNDHHVLEEVAECRRLLEHST
jgi:tetratricopeptide (TPR) repeat protein